MFYIVNIIVILYKFIFYPDLKSDVVSAAVYFFWLTVNVKGLLLAVCYSVLVNHMVSTRSSISRRYVLKMCVNLIAKKAVGWVYLSFGLTKINK